MLLALALVLFAVGMVFYARLIRTIWRLVEQCRADEPSRKFSKFFWISAWRYHKRHFPESQLRKQIVGRFALTWLFAMGGFALFVTNSLSGHWPH